MEFNIKTTNAHDEYSDTNELDDNLAQLDGLWFDHVSQLWCITIDNIEQLVSIASDYYGAIIEPPSDDYERPTLVIRIEVG